MQVEARGPVPGVREHMSSVRTQPVWATVAGPSPNRHQPRPVSLGPTRLTTPQTSASLLGRCSEHPWHTRDPCFTEKGHVT